MTTNDNITSQPSFTETTKTITNTTGDPNDHHHHHHPINPPLSWEDARNYLLHQVLLKWENEQSQSQQQLSSSSSSLSELFTTTTTTTTQNNNKNNNISCPHYTWDVLLSLILSLSLLILGYISHQNKNQSSHSYSSSLIAAGSISTLSSLLSLLILHHRHRSLLPSHRNAGLKRSVRSYISNLQQMSPSTTTSTAPPTSKTKITTTTTTPTTTTTTTPPSSSWSGTSLQDIYPVFRRTSSATSEGEWTRIPTLLMVKGDYVALQVGDTAPALVELVDLMSSSSSTRRNERRRRKRRVMIPGGERVTMDRREDDDGGDGEGGDDGLKLPRGKVRLGSDARELLFLCNGMRVFVLRETPLCGLLRRGHVTHKSPQIHRRGIVIRRLLSIAAVLNFAISTAVIFARRPNILSSDNQSVSSLLTITIPLFSSLCLLPMITPIILFVLEVLGTSRILTSVHRYTTSSSCCQLHHQQQLRLQKQQQQQQQSDDGNNNIITPYQPPPHLFVSYVLSTFRSRLNLPPRRGSSSSSILQPIPPLHLFLLEKLGVATALALIDDELACEPYSTPERLLIPSGRGLKLLDLCPVVVDDEEDDGDLSSSPGGDYEGGNNDGGPPSSPGASSTDSEDRHAAVDHDHGAGRRQQRQLQHHHHGRQQPIPRKTRHRKRLKKLKRRFKRRRSSSDTSGGNNTPRKRTNAETDEDEEEDDEIEEGMVQFEDPQWWHYLPSLKCIGLACLLIDDDNEGTADAAVAKTNSKNKLEDNNNLIHSPKKGGMVNSRSLTSLSTLQQEDNDKTHNTANHHHHHHDQKTTTTHHHHHHHHLSTLDRSFRRRSDQLSLASSPPPHPPSSPPSPLPHPLSTLLSHITNSPLPHPHPHRQLHSLASCIGFTPPDLHPFSIHRRLDLISLPLLRSRLSTSSHALGSEDSRRWGTLPVDARSVVVRDRRVAPRGAFQLLTVGDARVVLEGCVDSWQGDVGTMGALSGEERGVVREMEREWRLADLDVRAFSYAPVPLTLEGGVGLGGDGGRDDVAYLVDNTTPLPSASTTNNNTPTTITNPSPPSPHLPPHPDWSLTTNQIFLGLLGSSISPRKFLPRFYSSLTTSGVRFVYFSPRNMRRTKELASQMGIDVAWNCAISLRPLEDGWEEDPHRMTSHYADWDVNAKLPHGVESVKRHLEMVDNVPLLVSLYTDVTEETTVEMVNIFQNYHDTVIALGISHRSRNERTFTTADLSIGVDIHSHQPPPTNTSTPPPPPPLSTEHLLPTELQFVTAIASHSTIFNLPSPASMSHLPSIIAAGRAALTATLSATHFTLHSTLSLSLLCGLIPLNPYLSSLHPPPVGWLLYLLVLTPLLSLTMAVTPPPEDYMTIVPAKNNDEGGGSSDDDDDDDNDSRRCYQVSCDRVVGYTLARALPPAVLSHVLYVLSFPLLFRGLEEDGVREEVCPTAGGGGRWLWQCEGLMTYVGPSTNAASVLLLGSLAVTMVVTSMGFLYATKPLRDEPPWKRNKVWLVGGVGGGLVGIVIYLSVTLETAGGGAVWRALPWYYYLVGLVGVVGCVVVGEVVKGRERVHENRAVRLRRLQFETKLGMWSPK